jgi:hypothetical protein
MSIHFFPALVSSDNSGSLVNSSDTWWSQWKLARNPDYLCVAKSRAVALQAWCVFTQTRSACVLQPGRQPLTESKCIQMSTDSLPERTFQNAHHLDAVLVPQLANTGARCQDNLAVAASGSAASRPSVRRRATTDVVQPGTGIEGVITGRGCLQPMHIYRRGRSTGWRQSAVEFKIEVEGRSRPGQGSDR